MLRRISVVLMSAVCLLVVPRSIAHDQQEKSASTPHAAKASTPTTAKSQPATQSRSAARSGKSAKAKTLPIKSMPLTTQSVKARDLYQRALQDYELLYLERASIGWRAAAKEDPEFAAAFAMIALNSRDPEEMRTAREQAKTLAAKASPGEKLLVQWVAAAQEGNFLEGIAAMNDMVAMFPRDKHVLYIAANWLMGVQGNEQSHNLLHKALEVDPQFAPALNNLAYLHARNREFDEALQDMDEYAALVSKEPNSQDSYGEILRMAGLFEASLMHYRTALSIDPSFNTSQAGLGDTYSVMGDQERARQEYDKAIANEPNAANRFDYRMQKAITWVREKNYTDADREFWRISVEAHTQSYELQEAQALRRMAQYAADDQLALERLASAEDALTHRQNLSKSDRDEESAQILRERAARLFHAGKNEDAQKALNQLGELAAASRSRTIQQCWRGSAGAALLAQQKYSEAIAELEEDQDNPESLSLLASAYEHAGLADKARATQDRVQHFNMPTLEQVLALAGDSAKPAQVKDPVAAK